MLPDAISKAKALRRQKRIDNENNKMDISNDEDEINGNDLKTLQEEITFDSIMNNISDTIEKNTQSIVELNKKMTILDKKIIENQLLIKK